MQFSILRTEVQAQLGLDEADTTNDTLVNRWLNIAQQDIAMRYPWPFLKSRESVATVVDKTDGTVSVSAGGTTVTGASTSFAAADVGKFIQFAGQNDWYRISARASATDITIDTAYAQTAALSGATYTIRKFLYSLSSSADRLLGIKNWDKAIRLIETDFGTLSWISGANEASGGVSAYAMFGIDSSGNLQFMPYPFPTTPQVYEVWYIKRLSDMSSDSDLSVIPAKWHHVLIEGALIYGYRYLRKFDMATVWGQTYLTHIEEMKRNCKESLDEVPVFRAIDQYHKSEFIRLPGEFPVLGSGGN